MLFCLLTMVGGYAAAQTRSNGDVLDIQTFRFRDGLDVGFIQSLEFDEEGWLWLTGLESESGSNDFLNKGIKMQRFDGLSFHTVALPEVEENSFIDCRIFKRSDGLFYIKYSGQKSDYLFLFDPLNFGFTRIEVPDMARLTLISPIFMEGDLAYMALDYGQDTYLFTLNHQLNFKKLFSLERERAGSSFVTNLAIFKDHVLVSEGRIGIYAYDFKGVKLDFFDYKDVGLKRPVPYEPMVIRSRFMMGGTYLFDFRDEALPYTYDPVLRKFVVAQFDGQGLWENTLSNPGFGRRTITDSLGNLATYGFSGDEVRFTRYLKGASYRATETRLASQSILSLNSRNLQKELFIGEHGRLRHITFRDSPVTTFLDNYGVRNIMHWRGDEYLVASDYKGWYIVDVVRQTERLLPLYINGKEFIATETRALFRDGSGIWSNYSGGVILVDTETFEVELFREYPIWTMVDGGENLYYGSFEYPLTAFNKEQRKNVPLTKNDSLEATDIEMIGNTIYMTTKHGLLRYKDGKDSFVDFELPEGGFMMLDRHDSLGLLVTTTLGDVYHLDPEDEIPHLLYQHSIIKPIASILADDHGKLWMNTFSGVVSLDLKSKETKQFFEEDGLSNNEGNRYSELKTADGAFFFGTIKGLNYFHPDKISKAPVRGKLKLTSITRYSRPEGRNITQAGRGFLNDLREVILPAENRYLKIEVAPQGVINNLNTNLQYRLNEGEWQTLYNTGVIELNSLSAGSYALEVRLINSEGSPLGDSLLISIVAREFFYKTLWFVALILLLIFAISYYFVAQANKARRLEQGFSQSLLKVQESERTRIARDLHDSVGQQLILLKNQAQIQQNGQMVETASATLEEVRSITRDLHPVVLTQLGLTAALEELIHKLDEHTDIFFTTQLDNIDDALAKDEELNLYRIVQEILNNIVKHAQAASARLTLERMKGKFMLTIEDNGHGFRVEEGGASGTSLGLKTLQERATMLNAKLRIISAETGTRITLEIPK